MIPEKTKETKKKPVAEQSASKGLIYSAIPKIMIEVDPIAKNRPGHNYKFRGIDDAYQALQMILARNGVFTVPRVLSHSSEERRSSGGATLIYRILDMEYDFFASDGSYVTAKVVGEGMDSGDKASNKAMSVAHKYALLQVFCIPTAEAKDPENDHHEVVPKNVSTQSVPRKDTTSPSPTPFSGKNPGHVTHARKFLETKGDIRFLQAFLELLEGKPAVESSLIMAWDRLNPDKPDPDPT